VRGAGALPSCRLHHFVSRLRTSYTSGARCSVCLPNWYKSTISDAAKMLGMPRCRAHTHLAHTPSLSTQQELLLRFSSFLSFLWRTYSPASHLSHTLSLCSAARASTLPILRESLRISQELQDMIGQSNVLEAMGTEYVDAGDTAAAIQAWRQCIELRQVRTLLALLVLVLMCKY